MRAAAAVAIVVALVGASCADNDQVPADASSVETTSTTAPTTTVTTTSTAPTAPVTAPDGRAYPTVATDAVGIGLQLANVEQLLRIVEPNDPAFADLAHEQQMIYRTLGRTSEWVPTVLESIPPGLVPVVEAHIAARVAIGAIGHGDPPVNVPAWEIIEPLPAATLRGIYTGAAAETGIDWAYLAAINLLETGFGRIDGLSTAGAQGPMQFLPSTWEEVGEGSIDDPYAAIPAAARYLVRRGGPADMEAALWGYNNSDAYVDAVSTYAELFRTDEAVFVQAHSWEIHYSAAIGDLWLPVGYREEEPVAAIDHLAQAPWSVNDASTRPPTDG